MAFDALFQPISIGSLKLPNRIIMSAMSTRFPKTGGGMTEKVLEHYSRRARGGASLITVELADVHPLMPHLRQTLWLHHDSAIPEMRRLTDAIHENGSRASIQIGVFFRPAQAGLRQYTSSLESPEVLPNAQELSAGDLSRLGDIIAAACLRARKAGYDAVELHGMHGSIVEEFLSPYWNRRKDAYGGSREKRMRFPLELLEKTRKAVGEDFPVIFRICGSEFHPEGSTIDDAAAFARAAEERGLNAVSLSGGIGHIDHLAISSSYEKRGMLLPASRAVREHCGIPVIVANALTPRMAHDAVAGGDADIVALGRPLLADPDWPHKMAEGRMEEIRPCIRCNQGCMGGLRDASLPHILCLANPQMGRLNQERPAPAEERKNIVVIGGGPAGCEFAYRAAQRKHHVTLLEKESRLGGQFRTAAVPPGKEDFLALSRYFELVLPREGVDIRLNTEASAETVQAMHADVAVVATGSVPALPPIPGMDMSGVCFAVDVLNGKAEPRGAVAVLGGGATGLETAHLLVERGHSVTVVDMRQEFVRDIVSHVGVREKLLHLLEEAGVTFMPDRRVKEITSEGVEVDDRPLFGGGSVELVRADTVVVAMGQRPVASLADELEARGIQVVRIGDCSRPGNALAAIHEAYGAALSV